MQSERFAAAHLGALSLEAAFGVALVDRRRARAVEVGPAGRAQILAASEAAHEHGVAPGLGVVAARAKLPELLVRPRDPAAERRLLTGAAEAMASLSSVVELGEPDVVLLEISRSRRVLARMGLASEAAIARAIRSRLRRLGHRANVAIADDPITATTLARATPRPTIAPPGASAAAQAELPLAALTWTLAGDDPDGLLAARLAKVEASLAALGIRRVAELARFPAEQVKSRFGAAGATLYDRALGRAGRPLVAFVPPEVLVERQDFEPEVETSESVLFVLRRLLARLERRLEGRGQSMTNLSLGLRLADGAEPRLEVPLARPTRSAAALFDLGREHLERSWRGAELDGSPAVRGLWVEARLPVAEAGAQLDLFSRHAERLEKLEALLARLRVALGDEALYAAEVRDVHRPEQAWVRRPFDPARAIAEPPVEAPPRRILGEATVALRERQMSALPVVDERLAVLGAVEPTAPATPARAGPWPKPERDLDDEASPPLPPRPLELLEAPEPARWAPPRLFWRGEGLPVAHFGGRERFECEWWSRRPLVREYAIAHLEDGRRLWVFFDAAGDVWVHGVFD